MRKPLPAFVTLVLLQSFAPVKAGPILLYDNGAVNGTLSAQTLTTPYSGSDTFTVSAGSNLTSATVGLWVVPSGTPLQISWAIGTSINANNIGSGTSSLTNMFVTHNSYDGADIYESTFPISGAVVPGTTYYFTLSNLTTNTGTGKWDITNGPSVAYDGYDGYFGNASGSKVPGSDSESFQLYGTVVPDPPASPRSDSAALGSLLPGFVAGPSFLREEARCVVTEDISPHQDASICGLRIVSWRVCERKSSGKASAKHRFAAFRITRRQCRRWDSNPQQSA